MTSAVGYSVTAGIAAVARSFVAGSFAMTRSLGWWARTKMVTSEQGFSGWALSMLDGTPQGEARALSLIVGERHNYVVDIELGRLPKVEAEEAIQELDALAEQIRATGARAA
jgi:hypothetical protein